MKRNPIIDNVWPKVDGRVLNKVSALFSRIMTIVAVTVWSVVLFLLFVAISQFIGIALNAQTPVGFGSSISTSPSALPRVPGLIQWLDWYGQNIQGGSTIQGDFQYFTAWLPNASGLPVTSGLPVVGTLNDWQFGSSGNIGITQMDTFSWSSPTSAHMTLVNAMSSYGGSGGTNSPAGWIGHLTSSDANSNGSWKNRVPFSKGGILYVPVERQISGGTATVHDATFIMSPDSGAHWCNPYTLYNPGGGGTVGVCNSSSPWSATGDAPKCDALAFNTACLNAAYLDGTHSSMMWKQIDLDTTYPSNTNGSENWVWINFGTQDGAAYPSGAGPESGCDPATYTCFMLMPGNGAVGRVPNASILDISAWQYYTCPRITQNSPCSGSDDNNWTSTFASRTPVIGIFRTGTGQTFSGGNAKLINAQSVMYHKDFKMYVLHGQQTDFVYGPTLQGPWKYSIRYWPAEPITAWMAPGLGYTTLSSSPPHVTISTVGTQYYNLNTGTPVAAQWDLVPGKTYGGDAFQMNTLYPNYEQGSGFQFSAGGITGSFPRRGVIWSFDFADQVGSTEWPYFADRANNSVTITPCTTTYGASPPTCGMMGGGTSTTVSGSSPYISVGYINTASIGHFEVRPAESVINTAANVTPTAMQGNGSYSVVGVFNPYATTPFNRSGTIWATGNDGGNDSQSSVSIEVKNLVPQLSWGNDNNAHWQFTGNQTMTQVQWLFIATTVAKDVASPGCGTGCVPTVHMWVGLNGVLTDFFAGQTYTAINSGSTSAKTPAVTNGPFSLGLGTQGAPFQGSCNYQSFMVYGRELSFAEVSSMYKSMRAKMVQRGLSPPLY